MRKKIQHVERARVRRVALELVGALVGRKTQQGENYSSHWSLRGKIIGRVRKPSPVLEKILGQVLKPLLVLEKYRGPALQSLLVVEKNNRART